MKLGIYIRVSHEEQKKGGLSLQAQKKLGMECAIKNSFDYEVYEDAGLSGALPFHKRPALNSLIQLFATDEIQAIFVTEIDRLTRGDMMETILLKKLIKENNIKLYDVNGEVNLVDDTQELFFDLKSLLSAYEIKKTSTRIKRVLKSNAEDGKVSGGPFLNYGYAKDINKRFIINESEAKVVKKIFEMAINGKGTKVIANFLNDNLIPTKRNTSAKGYMEVNGQRKTVFKWRDSVVYKILTNPIYKGKRNYKSIVVKSPVIIQEEKYDLVQELIKQRKSYTNTTNKYFYLLKGKIFCGECQKKFYGRKREDNSDNQYVCSSQHYSKEFCGTRGINIDFLNDLVWNSLQNLDKDIWKFFDYYEANDITQFRLNTLKVQNKKLESLENQISNLLRLGSNMEIDETIFKQEMKKLNLTLVNLKLKIEEHKKALLVYKDKDVIIDLITAYVDRSHHCKNDNTKKQHIIQSLVDTIGIVWDKVNMKHTIMIDYKIDHLTQFMLGTEIELNYNLHGWRLDKQKNNMKSAIRVRRVVSDDLMGDFSGMPLIHYI